MEEAESKRDRVHYREKEGTGNSRELGHTVRESHSSVRGLGSGSFGRAVKHSLKKQILWMENRDT